MKQSTAARPSNRKRMVGQDIEAGTRVPAGGFMALDVSTWRLLLFGVLLVIAAISLCSLAGVLATMLALLGRASVIQKLALYLILPGGLALIAGTLLILADLFLLLPIKRQRRLVAVDELPNKKLTVVLTSWNDQSSIGLSVQDFLSHPAVHRVIVVDNGSSDGSASLARESGATVIVEPERGYGRCVYRALAEGAAQIDTELTVLCEGDMTYRAFDIDKFLAYIPHAEIVNGTRIVEQLRALDTQLTTFMYYGNFAVGKLLEAKYLGQGTFTDVGTTYKLCRNASLKKLLPRLNPSIDLEFNAHFLDVALRNRISLVECPVTFHARIGTSKGGNASNMRALGVGLRMIAGMLFTWR